MNRRKFLRLGAGAVLSSAVSGVTLGGYASLIEPRHLVLERRIIRLPHLSPALDGFRIALMSDHHLFPFTPRELVERAVEQTNALCPDVILLAGDYGCTDVESIRELAPILGRLNGKYGVFAILGNYDCWHQPDLIRAQLAECQTTPTGTFRTACAAAMTITADTRSHRPERHMEPPAR